MGEFFDLSQTATLLQLPFVQTALAAGAVLALLAGLLGPLVVGRGMAFATHGISELSFTGASAALLIGGAAFVGVGAFLGGVLVAVIFAVLASRIRENDTVIGVVMAFGLGLGVLFQALYTGRTANKFGLLVGQIVGVDSAPVVALAVAGVVSPSPCWPSIARCCLPALTRTWPSPAVSRPGRSPSPSPSCWVPPQASASRSWEHYSCWPCW